MFNWGLRHTQIRWVIVGLIDLGKICHPYSQYIYIYTHTHTPKLQKKVHALSQLLYCSVFQVNWNMSGVQFFFFFFLFVKFGVPSKILHFFNVFEMAECELDVLNVCVCIYIYIYMCVCVLSPMSHGFGTLFLFFSFLGQF